MQPGLAIRGQDPDRIANIRGIERIPPGKKLKELTKHPRTQFGLLFIPSAFNHRLVHDRLNSGARFHNFQMLIVLAEKSREQG